MWLAQCVKGQHTIYVGLRKSSRRARAPRSRPSCPRSRFPLVSCWNLSIDLKWDIDLMMCDSDKPTLIHRRRRLVLGQLDKVDTIWRLSAYLPILCLTEQLDRLSQVVVSIVFSICGQWSFVVDVSVPGVSELETHLAYMPTFELFFSRRYLVDILRSPFQG